MGFLGLGHGPFYYRIEDSRIGKKYIGKCFTRIGSLRQKIYISPLPGMINENYRWHGKWTNLKRDFDSNPEIELFVVRINLEKEFKKYYIKE